MSLVVRPSGPSDLAAVDALLARSYPVLLKADYPPSVLVAALPLIARARPELLRSGTYFVAERDGQVLAAGGWTPYSPTGGPDRPGLGHVRHFVTDDRHTRQGLARAVMDRIVADAAGAGFHELEALSTLTAEPFYAAMGFVADAPVQVPIGPGRIDFAAIRMLRSL